MKRLSEIVTLSDGTAIALVSLMALMLLSMGCGTAAACSPDACGTGPECRACDVQTAQEAEISTPVLERLLRSGGKVTVLDARTGKFDDGNRIPGARALSPDSTKEQVEAAVPAKEALVVTYCSNLKCQASRKLATHLRELGYANVLEYPDGIAGWKEAGNLVQKEEK